MAATDAHIALLAADPAFARGIPAEDMPLAERVLVLPRLDVDPGRWTPPPPEDGAPGARALLLDGMVGRHVGLGERVATQLLGPGDVFDPWSAPDGELLPATIGWSAFEPVTLAVLDGRFAAAARRWPALSATTQDRLLAATGRLAVHLAICQLPRVEQRLLALLWQLAERFGRVAPDGVVLDLRLTHRLIGELVGAQRPTVTLALASLLDDGLVRRREDGALVLEPHSRGTLAPTAVPAPQLAAPSAPEVADGDLMQRVRVLRQDFAGQKARTIAAVTHSASLRAARRAQQQDQQRDGDGEAA